MFVLGGVVGYARTSYDGSSPVVGFDMGGTSTDVSRYGGTFEHVFETTTAGVSIQSPQLDINTVASGGGSILFWHNGLFKIGPEACATPEASCSLIFKTNVFLFFLFRALAPTPARPATGKAAPLRLRMPTSSLVV